MTTGEVMALAAARGITLRAEAGRVKWAAPPGAMTPELCAAIRDHKADLLAALPAERPAVAGMTIREFANARRTVRVWSDLLGEEVLLASDNAAVPVDTGSVVYRARELTRVVEMDPEMLRAGHQVKRLFSGEVQEQPEPEPAPEWTPEELAEYDAALGEMARVLDDGALLEWVGQRFGVRFYVECGRLRAEGADGVPATVRAEVRKRQTRLVALLGGDDSAVATNAVEAKNLK